MRVQILKDSKVDLDDIIQRSPVKDIQNASPALAQCIAMSDVYWTGSVDGQTACAWGLVSPTILSERAYLWLITTNLVDDHRFVFVRHSQRFIEVMLEKYPVIVGHCVIGEHRATRWLKWLGAKFGEPEGTRIPFMIKKSRIT
jgi:hypothetical protein